MSREDYEDLEEEGLLPILDEAKGMVNEARMKSGSNDIAVIAFTDKDGTARMYAVARKDILDSLQENLPMATRTIERLSKPCSPARFFVVIQHEASVFCVELDIPKRGVVLN